jgi:surface polysaccharide O-acyltransferase-like enzyme
MTALSYRHIQVFFYIFYALIGREIRENLEEIGIHLWGSE